MTAITQAFVLGAGLGKRLRPLTDDLPKPLVPIFQKPLITFALDHLIGIGIKLFFINTHRLPEQFALAFPESSYGGVPINFVNEPVLLDTGGGIKNIEADLGDEPFITYSSDLLTDLPLQSLVDEHFARANDVTLALRRTRFGSSIALKDHRVIDILNRHGVAGNYDFANIAVWSPSIFQRIPLGQKVSFILVLADWLDAGGKIGGVVLEKGEWFNLGSRDDYFQVHQLISAGRWKPSYVKTQDWAEPVHSTAIVEPTATLQGCCVLGKNCRVGADAILEDTILWPGAQIASRSELHRCIVRTQRKVSGAHRNIDI
jgi:mannose-1-phosphate guanylyltransferase